MPVHHLLEQILDEYMEAAGLQSGQPLFQSLNSTGMEVTGRALNRHNAWAAIRKRAKAAVRQTTIQPVNCYADDNPDLLRGCNPPLRGARLTGRSLRVASVRQDKL
jgi:hypothetical protein